MKNPTLRTSFDCAIELTPDHGAALVGGKGAALARMVGLGLPVPPGFTLTTMACNRFLANGWTGELDTAISEGVAELEASVSKRFGDRTQPLLVSVRSGAPVSMPGMMDTVLNVGMTAAVAESLSVLTGDVRFGWDTYRRFAQSYASVVLAAPEQTVRQLLVEQVGPDEGRSLPPEALAVAATGFVDALAAAGYPIPDDTGDQLRSAVAAVFDSWISERAQVYRRVEGIDDNLGTAATVQMMVFGNLGERSGTGVAFSRDPSTGQPGIFGDVLQQAQGEDVVAGTHNTLPVSELHNLWPDVAAELERVTTLLERDLTDLADIEFTVEEGTFWLLQVRRGKHSPQAALRMAIDMAEDPDFPLTRADALQRIAPILIDPPKVPNPKSVPQAPATTADVLVTGLAASPGRAIGAVCVDVEAAVAAEKRGEAVILVRPETSPADIAGMAASRGIVTSLGGVVSHAAVVARSWRIPAVVGVTAINFTGGGLEIGGRTVADGTVITIDGSSGQILLGAHEANEIDAPEVDVLRQWERDIDSAGQAAAGGFAEAVTVETVGRALALKGMGSAESIGLVLGARPEDVTPVLDKLQSAGDAQELRAGTLRALAPLTERVKAWYELEAARMQAVIEPHLDNFHTANHNFKVVVTDWQMRTVDGERVPNDHADAGWDAEVVNRLRADIHAAIEPIVIAIAEHEPRIGRYLDRLSDALAALEAGDNDMMAHPLKDSYHTIWFELHEELIRLSGRNRSDEAQAGRA